MTADQIARFDPRTKTFAEYHIPIYCFSVKRIAVNPTRPSRVWYTGYYVDKVDYLDVLEEIASGLPLLQQSFDPHVMLDWN